MHHRAARTPLQVLAIPAFQDNYLWLIHDGVHAVAVDPGDSAPVLAALARLQLSLCAIVLTHHHGDHVGGVAALLRHADVPVFGPDNQTITGISTVLADGDQVAIAELGLHLAVLAVPGHTLDHLAYYTEQPDQGWLFCGDTLFAGGCGRLREGTPAQMAASLAKLAALPDATLVYCAHEYTLDNLRFARAAEPGNGALVQRVAEEQAKRAAGLPTVPSTIALEQATNPFLRYREPPNVELRLAQGRLAASDAAQPVAAFTALRSWKNQFT